MKVDVAYVTLICLIKVTTLFLSILKPELTVEQFGHQEMYSVWIIVSSVVDPMKVIDVLIHPG